MKVPRFLLMLIGIIFGVIIFASCPQTTTDPTLVSKTLDSISIKTLPTKTEYKVNEDFDPTGLAIESTIIEKYSDGTEKNFTEEIFYPNENLTFSGTDFSTVGTKNITVIYTKSEITAYTSFEVTVGEDHLILNTLDSISIKTLPTKTEYKVNEDFDPTGLVITANYTNYYSDNSSMPYSNDISYDNNMTFSGTDFSTVGTKTITVTYTENETSKSATFEITVKSAAFSSTINYTKFDSELNADLSLYNGKAMTLYLDTTRVNIATLFIQFETLYDAVGENGSVSISYADAANTTIEGGLDMDLQEHPENASKFNAFFNAIVPENATAETLPTVSNIFGVSGNLYGTGIDKFFTKYYDLGAGAKLQDMEFNKTNVYFDAIDHLNEKEGIAYDEANQYNGNYYDIDVNAAALMNGAEFKNVNIKGELKQELNFASPLTNVRFDVESKGNDFVVGAAGIGLIEFAGDAPSMTPRVDSGRLVMKKVNSNTLIPGGFSLDVSALSANDIANSSISTSGISAGTAFAETIYSTIEAENAAAVISSSVRVDDDLASGIDYYYATNQQWVKAANENKWKELEGGVKYPNVSALSAKANLDEKNNTLLNTILFNNQKVYNS